MKKILLLLPLMLLLTGCTTYKNVGDYAEAMQKVRKSQPGYTIEAAVSTEKEDLYLKGYFKDNRWKYLVSKDYGETYGNEYMIFTGRNVYTYDSKRKEAMNMDYGKMLSAFGANMSSKTNEINAAINFASNPLNLIYDWHLDLENPTVSRCKMWKFDGFGFKNGKVCRIIRYNDDIDLCVNDKYGVAVYGKFKTSQKGSTEFNIRKISISPLSDNEFKLPAGTRIHSMSNVLDSFYKAFKRKR